MRDIKFRGIDTMTGQWRFGDLVHNMKVTLTGVEPRVMVGGYEVKPETVGQFTGAKDKEGNEVYEGDVMKYYGYVARGENPLVTVYYDDTYHTMGLRRGKFRYTLSFCEQCKVAGNVHENPELLDENEEDSQ